MRLTSNSKAVGLSVCAALACASSLASAASLAYVDLVQRMTNLEYLATLPLPGDTCAQWSSYDRRSRYDFDTGKYVDWDANGDGDGVIRNEGAQLVLAEMKGPGCIWRIWSAAPKSGHVRIYLDGATEPAVDLPFTGYFDGKNEPFTRPAIVNTVASGCNNYTPIPYQKSCKVVADPGWGSYYHFTYESFPKGTHVPTFKRQLGPKENATLDAANQALANCGPLEIAPGGKSQLRNGSIGVDGSVGTANFDGPSAITGIQIKIDPPPASGDFDLLRSISLQIRWDGETEPSVWSPLGDFFGTAPGANAYRSLPMGLTEDGWWYCNWFMPFARSAEVTIKKDGKAPVKLDYKITTAPLKGRPSKYARFHAKWHRDAFPPTEPGRQIDWPMVKADGAGRFVGVMLHIWNPRGGWWGEGDEKYFVDGEKFPSTFGTGSEDYFGYAWGNPQLFQNAYHNQTHNDGNNKGHVSVNRWLITDDVPFQKSFEGCIEKYMPNSRPTLYAATAYWYLAPNGTDPYRPTPLAERVDYWGPVQPIAVAGALEGEKLKVLSITGGKTQEQDMSGYGGQWSNDAHLWWTQANPGDKLELALPVSNDGKYDISMQLTKAPDYGIVQISLDGEKLGGPVDLYHQSVTPSGAVALGTRDLTTGEHKLTFEITGANNKAVKSYMVGLDYVKLAPANP